MAKEDVVQYNIRLNLSNPFDLKLHQAIMSANMDIYKSKNTYLKKVAYRGVFGEADGLGEMANVIDLAELATKKDLEDAEIRIKYAVMQEMFKLVVSQTSIDKLPLRTIEEDTEKLDEVDDAVADAARGYF